VSKEDVKKIIQDLVDLETRGWDAKDPEPFLSIIHHDIVWAWPPHEKAHDPALWVFDLGRFDRERWRRAWQELFDTHELVHNRRKTVKIEVTREEDGAYAVVDVDTLWRNVKTGKEAHWKGRACKFYTKMADGDWKLISHTGLLDY
jgi:ketosteroid isomerase-like protein